MLLHKSYINVAIANILLYRKGLYDLHRPRYGFATKNLKISAAKAKNSNISKNKGLSTSLPSFAYHNVTFAVILNYIWSFQLLSKLEISVFKIAIPDTKNKTRIAPPPRQLEFRTFFWCF